MTRNTISKTIVLGKNTMPKRQYRRYDLLFQRCRTFNCLLRHYVPATGIMSKSNLFSNKPTQADASTNITSKQTAQKSSICKHY